MRPSEKPMAIPETALTDEQIDALNAEYLADRDAAAKRLAVAMAKLKNSAALHSVLND